MEMNVRGSAAAYRQAAAALPPRLRQEALALGEGYQAQAEELRLRVGRPLSIVLTDGEWCSNGPPVTQGELEQLVEIASRASLHAVLDQVRRGYLTMEGGHRIGLCGTATLRDGAIHSLSRLACANLRVAREVKGAADGVLPRLCPDGRLVSTLILAPPGLGKTTLLRDVIRQVSDGASVAPLRVALMDERGEVAALRDGQPQLDVGGRTDVLEGCPKAQGLMLLLRAMNPQVLAADEITAPEDVAALEAAVGCGVTLLATAHGADVDDLRRRPVYRPLLEGGLLRRLVTIGRTNGMRRYDVEELD